MTTNRNSTVTAPTYTNTSTIARNSACSSIHTPAALKNDNTSQSAECTGFLLVITRSAANIRIAANA